MANSSGINVANRVLLRNCVWVNPNTTAFKPSGASCRAFDVMVEGCDLSGYGSGRNLVDVGTLPAGEMIFRNCKTGASVSFTTGSFPSPGPLVKIHNADSADTQHVLYESGYAGSVALETTQVRSGGANNGIAPYSWRMTSSANCNYFVAPLETPEFPAIWNDTVGSAITIEVEVLHDSATALTDAECWLEVQYLRTTGYPLGLYADDRVASVLAAPANQPASSETWTTTGMSNPNKQVLSVTVTPQEVGYIQARVALGKASYTIVVDPMMTVS